MSVFSLLEKWLIRPEEKTDAQLRQAYGLLCGVLGIVLNLLLFLGKFLAGVLSGSIAITADAFNNLSDAGSSLLATLGFRVAEMKADRHHPFGHGRMEYITGLVVSMLILLMGFELAQNSIRKIRHPEAVDFSWLVAAILAVSIAVKLYMAFYNRRTGDRLHAPMLLATAADSLSDSVATLAVLLATLVGHFTGAQIDGWVGMLVAVFICWSGFQAAKETLNPLLGMAPDPEFVEEIRTLVLAHPKVLGIHDLIVHDYGPGRRMISLHAEVSASDDILTIHDEIDNVERELQEKLNCPAVIHMDPIVTDDGLTQETRRRVETLVRCIGGELSIHDFRMVTGPTHTNVIFDVSVPFGFRLTDGQVEETVREAVGALDGTYYAIIHVERSYT